MGQYDRMERSGICTTKGAWSSDTIAKGHYVVQCREEGGGWVTLDEAMRMKAGGVARSIYETDFREEDGPRRRSSKQRTMWFVTCRNLGIFCELN